MKYVIQNLNIVPENEAVIQPNDRSYHFGDGVYEVVRVYQSTPFQLEAHWDRLFASAHKLDIQLHVSADELTQLTTKLIEKNQLEDGSIYLQVSRGASDRNHLYSRNETALITGFTMAAPTRMQDKGISAWVTDDIRWLRCDIKTVNLLGNIMAKREAADANCHEAIMHRDGIVTEGSSSNLFLVNEGILYTHPVSNLILNGITRQVVIQLAHEAGIKVVEEAFPKEVLMHTEEAFITSTTSEITPVTEFKGQVTTQLPIGNVTKKLQEMFAKLI